MGWYKRKKPFVGALIRWRGKVLAVLSAGWAYTIVLVQQVATAGIALTVLYRLVTALAGLFVEYCLLECLIACRALIVVSGLST